MELMRYQVTFVVRDENGKIDHKWTATWSARNYGHAETLAVEQLKQNKDNDSVIERIELW